LGLALGIATNLKGELEGMFGRQKLRLTTFHYLVTKKLYFVITKEKDKPKCFERKTMLLFCQVPFQHKTLNVLHLYANNYTSTSLWQQQV
jgi:hypothetical protein